MNEYEQECVEAAAGKTDAALADHLANLGKTMRQMPPGELPQNWLDSLDEEVSKEAARRLRGARRTYKVSIIGSFHNVRAWYHNVWQERHLIRSGDYRYYYCDLRCFLSNQHLCNKERS